MTVDPFVCYERNVHVKQNKSFYPANIPNSHNQLRHLICSPTVNRIYYVDGKDVWCLDPSRSRRTHITELSFDPSCTASAHGWFCAGGLHSGHFAYIKLLDSTPSSSSSGLAALNTLFGTRVHPDSSAASLHVNYVRLGSAITNSVSIHRLPRLHHDSEDRDDTVAVITNNDFTVRVFSLTNKAELTKLEFEYAMNHASISPDGTLMMIVGDQEIAFVYERIPVTTTTDTGEVRYSGSTWSKLRELNLYKPPKAKVSGYFTTAWSNSGALCATASELGFVTVIDSANLRDPDSNPVVAIVPSSRPQTTPGAIRSMCFAPDQFDLLLWTENMGRMCVADLRSGLRARQVVALDAKAEGVTQIHALKVSRSTIDPELRDFDLDMDMIRRQQRQMSDEETASDISLASDLLGATSERRRLQREIREAVSRNASGLTEEEQMAIDGIRTTRQQEARYQARQRDSSSSELHNGSVSTNPHTRSSTQSVSHSNPSRRRRQWESLLDSTDEIGREHSNISSLRDFLNSRLDDHSRIEALSAMANHRNRNRLDTTASSSSSRPSSASNTASNVTLGNQREAWHTIEAAMRATEPSTSGSSIFASNLHRVRSQESQDSETPSVSELLQAQTTAASNSTNSRTTSVRATLPTWRGSSSTYLDAERRRAMEMNAPASELTTRGQVLYARQRERERLRTGEANDDASSQEASSMLGRFDSPIIRRMAAGTRPIIGEIGFIGSEGGHRRNIPTGTDGIDDSNEPEDLWGVGTAGICWGDNGRVVYVGTEEGIFELNVNLIERQFWPAITPR